MKRAAVCFATFVVLFLTVASVLRWHRNQVAVDAALRNISESCQVRIHTLGRSVDMEMTDGLKQQLTDAILNNLSFPMDNVKRAAYGRLAFLDSDGKEKMLMTVFSKNVVQIKGVLIELSVNALDIFGVDARRRR